MEKIFEKKTLRQAQGKTLRQAQGKIKKSENFSEWYTDVILKSGLADYAPVKGCMVIRPYGFALWENIKKSLDEMIRADGISNAYFPIFIPFSFLKKEKEHIKGFSPQLAVVTHGGGKKLTEPLVVRPTSETVIYAMYSKWIKSWRDLPLLINQWANIVRWEMRTYLFLRTMEFLWQEGHTCHRTHQEALGQVKKALARYQSVYEDFLAIPGILGKKSEAEKFPGALDTLTFEMLMPDGKALQGCTSHDLGQNFSKPFNISFQDKNGKKSYVWQTCWGFTTRSIGALIMVHGDDQGLVLPPKIASIQVIIIPIFEKSAIQNKKILAFAEKIKQDLIKSEIRVELDARKQYSPGWKFNEWEMKGVPLRIEVGQQEIKGKFVKIVRRDNNEQRTVNNEQLTKNITKVLEEIRNNLYKKAQKFLRENTHQTDDYNEFKKIMKTKRGFIWAFWCENPKCEEKIKKETKATVRLLPLNAKKEVGKCIYCGKKAQHKWLFAQAY